MKSFSQFIRESAPTNSVGNTGYTGAANSLGPVAGFDKRLFGTVDDILTQDYQTPGEVGLAKWRFSNVYPVMRLSLSNNRGDGPSIDQMVDASKEYVNLIKNTSQDMVKKNFSSFIKSIR
jgi:hypothetical protein|tara:strand:+ start:86 stop:445 length:360 start_codon:yes stop_codon:yes gene_type:complete